MRTMRIRLSLVAVFAVGVGAVAQTGACKEFGTALQRGAEAVRRHDYKAAAAATAKADELAASAADRVKVKLMRASIAFCSGEEADAKRLYDAIARDPSVDGALRFRGYAGLLGVLAKSSGIEMASRSAEDALDALRSAGVTPEQKYAAYNEVAQAMTHLREYELVRAFIGLADGAVPARPKKSVRCRYMRNPPLGAAGWLLSDFIKDPANKETRFHDYNQKAADRLFAETTAERSAGNDDSKKRYFLDNTGFTMVYNETGWHIFVLCGDRDIQDKILDNEGAGALEMFYTPGLKGEGYRQWIIAQPSGKVDHYEWNSPHRRHRRLEGYFRSETVVSGESIGTYIFIPWEVTYDRLPFAGQVWRFGCIRWSPAGGLTWGGKVHETGGWGQVEFDAPTPEQVQVIRKSIARKAYAKYRKMRGTLAARWQDEVTGDPDFFDQKLKAVIEQLDAQGARLRDHRSLSRLDVDELFADAVPDWMEFAYVVSELRRAYLEDHLVPR